jgi:hypothetical protein
MSRLIDKLKQALQAEHPPMGFRAAKNVSKPRMLIVARLSQTDVDNPAELVAGADAGLLPIDRPGSGVKLLEKIVQAVPDIPWGGWLDSTSRDEIKQVEKAGFDFLFFPAAKMSLALLEAEKMGRILAVEASLDEGLIRAINELPADAVFVDIRQKEENFLTWQHLMLFQCFSTLLTKPLLVPVPFNVATNELQLLWELGVGGVVVEATPGQPVGGLKKLHQMIDGLALTSKRKRMKARAVLPYLKEEASQITEEEEEE